MDLFNVFLLAVFQGGAEFLPISSSGHLAVLGNWLGINPEANFSLGIVLHAGTLLAILVFGAYGIGFNASQFIYNQF